MEQTTQAVAPKEAETSRPVPESGEQACACGHDHDHGHGDGCDCGHEHAHEEGCDCGHEHAHGLAHKQGPDQPPIEDFDPDERGLGWEGVCPCGCGGSVHHAPDDPAAPAPEYHPRRDLPAWDGVSDAVVIPEGWDAPIAINEELAALLVSDRAIEDYPVPDLVEFDYTHDGTRWHVRRWGDPADIPLLALHGFMQTGATWEQAARRLCQGHCLYAVDLLGHGGTDKPGCPHCYALPAQAEALAAFITEVMLPQNAQAVQAAGDTRRAQAHVHVLGYSMGGRLALELAIRHSDLVYTLVLESAGFGPVDESDRAALAARAAVWADMLRTEGIQAFVDYWEELPLFASQQRLDQATRDALRAERLANDPAALALCVENAGAHTMPTEREMRERLSYCWTPVLYICGTADEKYLVQAENVQRMGLDTKALMGGHNLHLEAPDAFTQAIEDFYRRNEMRGC